MREGKGRKIPIVALPPNFIRPNLKKGIEMVVIPGTTSRMTAVSSGLVLILVAILMSFVDLRWSIGDVEAVLCEIGKCSVGGVRFGVDIYRVVVM